MKPCFPFVCATILLLGLGCAGGIGSGLADRSPRAKHGPTAKSTHRRAEQPAVSRSGAEKPDKKLASLKHPGAVPTGRVTITAEPTTIVTSPATEAPVQTPPARDTGVVAAAHAVAENEPQPVVPASPVPSDVRSAAAANANPTGTYASADDYSWVQGKLTRVHSRGGHWEVRYADYSRTDEYGGKFILVGQMRDDLHEGDVIRIWGRVLGYDNSLRGTAYRAEQLQVVQPGGASP